MVRPLLTMGSAMTSASVEIPAFQTFWALKHMQCWLVKRLSPATVILVDGGMFAESEYRWRIDFPSGRISFIRVSNTLVESGPEQLETLTEQVEAAGLVDMLERSGPEELALSVIGTP